MEVSRISGRNTEEFDIETTKEIKVKDLEALSEKVKQANEAQKELILSTVFDTFYEFNGFMGKRLYENTMDVEEQTKALMDIAEDLKVKISDVIRTATNFHSSLISDEVGYVMEENPANKDLQTLMLATTAMNFFAEDVVSDFVREKGIFASDAERNETAEEINIYLIGADNHDRSLTLHTNGYDKYQDTEISKPFKFQELLGGDVTQAVLPIEVFSRQTELYVDDNEEEQMLYYLFDDEKPFDTAKYGDTYTDDTVRDALNARIYEELIDFIHSPRNPMELTLTLERELVSEEVKKYISKLGKKELKELKSDLKKQIERAEAHGGTEALEALESLEEELSLTKKALKKAKQEGTGIKR
jgi:hypothetical protein